jgi:tRNA pseudouridine55 synthase
MDGVIVIDKPEGLTSHDVVAAARRVLGEKRIGHTGTLDPLATGVLPLACGRATRLVRFLTSSDKEYEATILFGVTTDTLDVTGEETSRSKQVPTSDALADALASLTGEYLQAPPAYSAKKVGGRRAYELARRDEPVVLAPARVRADSIDLLEFHAERCRVRLRCSAGFYVRSLARDLGERCGTGACLESLRRTRSGDFTLEEAVPLDALEAPSARQPAVGRSGTTTKAEVDTLAAILIPMEKLLPDFPFATVTSEGLARVSHGRQIRAHDLVGSAPGTRAEWVRLLDGDGALVALATPTPEPGILHPEVVLI